MIIHRWLFDAAQRARYCYLDLKAFDRKVEALLVLITIGFVGHCVTKYYTSLPKDDLVFQYLVSHNYSRGQKH